ncbi:hypothetical protein C4Q28_12025 [Pseudomonas sp. SWI6]|uniref:DUF2946 family protein n=1 Tax=unclassified Pseudomonas TaxID=196821 RepID=UPI000CE5F41B|nr:MULTISPECIES: DUF2946 family protein [unclassified Pseudomonas]AVD82831.1 hypothetical protein C4Q28_12025 [Pseudomonas sp. SWI6]WEZ86801.1 DUF2946 domain-containing protein [Pseudomonas sp. NyZ480]
MRLRIRTQLLLLACFAVMFNLLAMPLDRALRESTVDESLILGSFCSLHGVQSLPKSLLAQLKLDQSDLSNHADIKSQVGDCCCGHAGQAALPNDYFKHLYPRFWPDTLLLGEDPDLPLPRQLWPAIPPRASPLA